MPEIYSEQLVARAQAYFSKKCGRVVSPEEAVEYLNALADLWESFAALADA